MPLPGVGHKTKQCAALSKRSGTRCKNPAVVSWGERPFSVCRMHGARKPSTIRRGANHPAHKHGQETLEAKTERSMRLAELRGLEAMSFALGLATRSRWRGRKPRRAEV